MARTTASTNVSGRGRTVVSLSDSDAARVREVAGQCHALMRRRTDGKGLCVLLKGGSRTGKTLAARVIATELKLGMYRIDLSAVVSKYIGETEKNLSAVFREAENTEVILFFDEADALFGKRTSPQDAHDRYANLDTNYLLQLIASFRGVVVLAANDGDTLDDALLAHTRFEIDLTRRHAKRRI